MRIGDRQIGIEHPPYVIAEIGVNHDGEVGRALSLTDAAADAGADAVKLQFFETDRLMSRAAKLAAYQKNAGETDPIAMLRRLELSIDEMSRVVERAHERGIHAIVTVFSTELVEAAETLPWDAYKTASPDIVNRPLLEALAETGKPMIVSTGASTLDEVVRAVGWLDDARDRLAVLQCVSSYPVKGWERGFGGITELSKQLECPIGYSDHTKSHKTGKLAIAFGACILEKHITDDRRRAGPDHSASLLDAQFAEYIRLSNEGSQWVDSVNRAIHDGVDQLQDGVKVKDYANAIQPPRPAWDAVWAVGQSTLSKRVLDSERDVREVSRQSVVITRDIAAGETITREMLTTKRPGTGILAYRLGEVVGSVAKRAIEADVPVVEEDLA